MSEVPFIPACEAVRILREMGNVGGVISRALNVHPTQVSHWKNNRGKPSPDNRRAIFRLFGIPEEAWTQPPKPGAPIPRPAVKTEAYKELRAEQQAQREREFFEQHESISTPVFDEEIELLSEDLKTILVTNTLPSNPKEGCIELVKSLRDARKVPGITGAERVKLASAETRALALLSKLESEEESLEAKIVKHPKYQALKKAILDALVSYPDAANAVLAALKVHEHGN